MFDALSFGDILRNADDAAYCPTLILNRKGPIMNPANRTIGAHDPVFFIVFAANLMGEYALNNSFTVFVVNTFHPGAWGGVKGATGSSPDAFETGADIFHLLFERIGHPEHVGDVLCQLSG